MFRVSVQRCERTVRHLARGSKDSNDTFESVHCSCSGEALQALERGVRAFVDASKDRAEHSKVQAVEHRVEHDVRTLADCGRGDGYNV